MEKDQPVRLTKKVVDALEPRETRYWVRDDAIPGFRVRVEPSGIKTYSLRYRAGGRAGALVPVKLGRHGEVTADQARAKAEELRGSITAGEAPRRARATDRGVVTVAKVLDAYIGRGDFRESTSRDMKSLRKHIDPLIGGVPAATLDVDQVQDMHDAISAKVRRGVPMLRTANKAVVLLSAAITWARTVKGGRLIPPGFNPCELVEQHENVKRTRFLTPQEVERLFATLDKNQSRFPVTCDVIRVMAYSGRRLGEVCALKWADIDEDLRLLSIDTKTGAKTLALDTLSLAIIVKQPRPEGAVYVFPGDTGGPTVAPMNAWQRVLKHEAKLPDFRLHDLRHTLASYARDERDMDLHRVGGLLGHVDLKSSDRYAHTFSARKVKDADRAAKSIVRARKMGKKV